VGDFESIETKTEGGVPVRVYAPTGMQVQKDGKFSLDLAAKTLDFFGKEFGSPYPLPKMDMVTSSKHPNNSGRHPRFLSWSNGELGSCYLPRCRFIV
jgi:hypothetical protein